MLTSILKDCKITRVMNAVTAGQTSQDSSVLDMAGFDGVIFIALLNTVVDTCVLTLTAKENTANSTSSPTPTSVTDGATAALTASGNSNNVLAVDVVRPSKRYVFANLTRTTANATIDGIIAIQYRTRNLPVTQPATLAASALSTPEV